jgi:hypothetical protein
LYCLIGSLFFIFINIDFVNEKKIQQEYQYNIINIVWAQDINGTENIDNIIGTISQDKIKGFSGNDTILGKRSRR